MTRIRVALAAALLAITAPCLAADVELKPRRTPRKLPTHLLTMPAEGTGALTVKVVDEARGNASADGTKVVSLTGRDVSRVNQVLGRYGLTVRKAINHSLDDLAELEERAAGTSGFAQPYLASILRVEGPPDLIGEAARALNDLPEVEWVVFEATTPHRGNLFVPEEAQRVADSALGVLADEPAGDPEEAGGGGACCLPGGACLPTTGFDECVNDFGGVYQGTGTVCSGSGFCGVCCIPPFEGCENDYLDTRCAADGGIYAGDHPGLDCTDGTNPCALSTGACCLFDGTCDDGVGVGIDRDDCEAQGGQWFGPGTTCPSINNCIDGACCIPDATCQITSRAECEVSGGTFFGSGITCIPREGSPGFCSIGACCLAEDTCQDGLVEWTCRAAGGAMEFGVECADADCETDCGEELVGPCFDPLGNGTAFCDDEDCCTLICDIDPYCCEEDEGGIWDAFCAAQANVQCELTSGGDPPVDRCASPWNGSCFIPHDTGGCANEDCCNTICVTFGASFCCDFFWDDACVFLAARECLPPTAPGVTPDFVEAQGYLTPGGWSAAAFAELDALIPQLLPGIPFWGYGGQGWALDLAGEPFTDLNGNDWWDEGEPFDDFGRDGIPFTFDDGEGDFNWTPPSGLQGIAEQLLHGDPPVDGTGKGNLTKGETFRVAVLDDAYWPDHEELEHVKIERGQSLNLIREITFPDHGTACLSIISAKDNRVPGVSGGVTGIVPEAQTWFFPLTSLEEGPRELTAWTSALKELQPGDVISASYQKVIPLYNCNNSPDTWTMIRMASDLGITCCVSAGDDCFNLDGATDQGTDSGGIVVGACTPGFPFYRLSDSNYCIAPTNARTNIVHAKAWGDIVACAGIGQLFLPEGDRNRSYGVFWSTHAATPQLAGMCVGLQGIAKQFYGITLMPEQIRASMGLPGIPPANPSRFLLNGGFNASGSVTCALDIDEDAGPHMIGNYPEPISDIREMLLEHVLGFDAAPIVEDVVIVRGQNVIGNKFSIKGSENNYLNVTALYTDRDEGGVGGTGEGGGVGGGIFVPEIEDITYLASGYITDIVVVAESDITGVNTMIVESEMAWPNVFALMFVEAYNWRLKRWTSIDVITDPGSQSLQQYANGDYQFGHVADAPGQYVRATDNRILVRLWTLGFPLVGLGDTSGQGGGDNNYKMRFDLVNIFVSEEFGESLP